MDIALCSGRDSGRKAGLILLRSGGIVLRLKGLDAEEPSGEVLDDSLMALSCIDVALMRRLLARLNRLDIADVTEDLDRTEGVRRGLG